MFSFSVMQSSFGFSDIKIIAVPTGSSIYNLSHLATAKSIFVRKERFNAASTLKNHSKVNPPVEFINQCRNKGNITGGARERRRREPLGGSGGMLPQKILKARGLEMLFPAFSKSDM